MSHLFSRRTAALVAAPVLALGGLAALSPAPASAAPSVPLPAVHGADWLASELDGGLLIGEYGSDVGLTIDTAIALAAVGGHSSDLAAIAAGVDTEVDASNPSYNYVSGEAFGDVGSTYAGAVAKTVVLAQITGQDTATFGGEDLVARLADQVSVDPASAGRISDTSSYGDNANTLGQSFAVRALDGAGSALTDSATDFLLAQQCDAGFFRTDLGATLASDCDSDEAATGATDATALAILNLAGQDDDTDVAAAIAAAADWLVGTQSADGSWGSDAPTEAPNANSTGLATTALGGLGRTAPAAAGAVWLRQHQADDFGPCTTGLTGSTGSVALDDAALADGRDNGLTVQSRDQFRRASAQAVPGLVYAPAGAYSSEPTSRSGYVRAGSTRKVHADGVAPGQTVCFARGASQDLVNANRAGHAVGRVELRSGSGVRTYTVGLTDRVLGKITFHALGAKTLPFSLKSKVPVDKLQRVTVRGLAPREAVTVTLVSGDTTSGFGTTANKAGRMTVRVSVGTDLGKQTVKVVGQFGNRKAVKTFTVTKG